MMYIPQIALHLYFERIAPRVYRVVAGDLYTAAPHCMVDEAIEILVGEDYFYELEDAYSFMDMKKRERAWFEEMHKHEEDHAAAMIYADYVEEYCNHLSGYGE